MPEFNQSLLVFFNLNDSQIISTLLYDYLNLVINEVQLWAVGSPKQEKGKLVRQQACKTQITPYGPTALSNAAAPIPNAPPSVAAGARGYVELASCSAAEFRLQLLRQ